MIRSMARKLIRKLATKIGVLLYEVRGNIARETLPVFGNNPKNLRIDLPRRILNPGKMFLGDDVWLGPDSFLIALWRYPASPMQHPDEVLPTQQFTPKIVIGNRVTSTGGLQIAATREVVVEDDVLFSSNIYITDNMHGYETANKAYKYQPINKVAPVFIGRGSWIGQNVVILPGVTIGQNVIVGANSVVTRSIPPRSIAVGAPARVIKSWDETNQSWTTKTPPSATAGQNTP